MRLKSLNPAYAQNLSKFAGCVGEKGIGCTFTVTIQANTGLEFDPFRFLIHCTFLIVFVSDPLMKPNISAKKSDRIVCFPCSV